MTNPECTNEAIVEVTSNAITWLEMCLCPKDQIEPCRRVLKSMKCYGEKDDSNTFQLTFTGYFTRIWGFSLYWTRRYCRRKGLGQSGVRSHYHVYVMYSKGMTWPPAKSYWHMQRLQSIAQDWDEVRNTSWKWLECRYYNRKQNMDRRAEKTNESVDIIEHQGKAGR